MRKWVRQLIEKMTAVVKNHGWAFLIAILVGIFSIAPHLLAWYALGSDYKGFPPFFHSNEDYYIARIQDIVEGYWSASSPYLYEYKGNVPVVPPVGEILYALPTLLFGFSLPVVLMVAKFIFPTFLFLLVYFLLHLLSKRTVGDKVNAIFGGALITLGEYLVNYKSAWQLLIGQSHREFVSIWTRPVNPIVGALLLFLFLIFLWKSINLGKWIYLIISGVILGLMLGYAFSWMVAVSMMGGFGLIALMRRHFGTFKKILLIATVSITISLPIWYFWFCSFFVAKDGELTSARLGVLLTRYPIINKVVVAQTLLFLVVFFWDWYRNKKIKGKFEEWWWFAAALTIGNWLVYNQQIITGKAIWPPHLTQYTVPIAFLTMVLISGNYFKVQATKLWGILVAIISGVVIVFVIVTTSNYGAELKEFSRLQHLTPFFDWLNAKTEKDCVVLTNGGGITDNLSRWIPAFTHCNTYLTAYYPQSVTEERVYFNYAVDLRLRGVEEKDLERYLWGHKDDLRDVFYKDWSQAFTPIDDSWLAGPIQTIIDRYHDFIQEDFITALRRYKIDYLASEEPLSASLKDQLLQAYLLGKFGSVYVYQL